MSFVADVAARLIAQGVVTAAKIGIPPAYQIPVSGDCLKLTDTGGLPPYHTHNEGAQPALTNPSLQIMTHGVTYESSETMIHAALAALRIRNTTLSGTFYLWIEPSQEPFPLGLDEKNRVRFVVNIRAERRP